MPKKFDELTSSQIDAVKTAFAKGVAISRIADEFGLTPASINYKARKEHWAKGAEGVVPPSTPKTAMSFRNFFALLNEAQRKDAIRLAFPYSGGTLRPQSLVTSELIAETFFHRFARFAPSNLTEIAALWGGEAADIFLKLRSQIYAVG